MDKGFYDKRAVDEALHDFNGVCEGRILNDKMEIELVPKGEIKEPLKEEFCNYVLGLMKNKTFV